MSSEDRPVVESRLSAPGRHSDRTRPAAGVGPEPPQNHSVLVPAAQTSVLVVDEHSLSRAGLTSLLATAGLDVVGEADSAESAAAMARHLHPEVILIDFDSGAAVLEGVRLVAALAPHSRVVVLFADAEFDVRAALALGACGCVVRGSSSHEILTAIRAAARGELVVTSWVMERLIRHMGQQPRIASSQLTPRELETLGLLARGWDNARIAEALYVSRSTVKHHISSILNKLGVDNRLQAAVLAVEQRLLDGQ